MAVYRIEKTKNYTVMSNYHLRDKNLTLKAKGLLSVMLSLPEEWHYSIRGLASVCREGVTSISSALKELEKEGYMMRHQPKVNGKFQEIEYVIYETPQKKTGDNGNAGNTGSRRKTGVAVKMQERGSASEISAEEAEAVCSNLYLPYTENRNTESPNPADRHAYKRKKKRNTERRNTEKQNTEKQNTEKRNPLSIHSINQETDEAEKQWMEERKMESGRQYAAGYFGGNAGSISASKEWEQYRMFIMENIGFKDLCTVHTGQKSLIEGMVDIITGAVCSTAETLRIDQEEIPKEIVKSRMLRLNFSHIEYVLHCFLNLKQKIHRIDRYLLTMLYKAPLTQSAYYANWVNSMEFAGS